jgi:hypothetical protein
MNIVNKMDTYFKMRQLASLTGSGFYLVVPVHAGQRYILERPHMISR